MIRFMKIFLFLTGILFLTSPVHAQVAKIFGYVDGTNYYEESFHDIKQTSDGGYILIGDAGLPGGAKDIWVLKLDNQLNIEWQQTYGATGDEEGRAVIQTQDGGYLIAGATTSFGSGDRDIWILKLDSSGAIEWQRTYGFEGKDDEPGAILEMSAGFIVAGIVNMDFNIQPPTVNSVILKLGKSDGSIVSENYYDNSGILDIQSLTDGSLIIAGGVLNNQVDGWVTKIDSDGTISWSKIYEGAGFDLLSSIKVTSDGYIAAGCTGSETSGDCEDFLVLKLDTDGSIAWQKTYGGTGTGYEEARAIVEVDDGYVIAGESESLGYTNPQGEAQSGALIIKVNKSDGSIIWSRAYGYPQYGGYADSIIAVADGLVVAGEAFTYWGDGLFLKLDSDGLIPEGCSYYLEPTVTSNNASLSENDFSPEDLSLSITESETAVQSVQYSATEELVCPSPSLYSLSISIAGNGYVYGEGISCPNDCMENYPSGTTVNLIAVWGQGYQFDSWGGDCSACGDNQSCDLTINSNMTCTANFVQSSETYLVTVNKSGTGSGTVTSWPEGINCGEDCSQAYPVNTGVILTAQASPGSIFTGWGGDCGYCGQGNWCWVDITSDRSCTASFEQSSQTYNLIIEKSGTGSGTVTSWPEGINCGEDCSESYPVNTWVTLTAEAGPGSIFTGWAGDPDCLDGQVLMVNDITCRAVFSLPSEYWIKTFGTENSEGIGSALTLPDGSIVIAGESSGDILVMKLDSDGFIQWQSTYDNNDNYDEPDKIFKTSDGYIITGRSEGQIISTVILKLDDNGTVNFAKALPADGILKTILEEEDGYIIGGAIFNGTDYDGLVFKLSKDGSTIQWAKNYSTSEGKNEGFLSIKKLSIGGYIGAGAYDLQFDQYGELSSAKIWVVKTDDHGNILWQKDYGYGIAKIVEEVDNSFVVGAIGVFDNNVEMLLINLDENGDVLWAKSYGGPQTEEIMDLMVDTDGYAIAGRTESITGNNDGIILKIDTQGNILWQKYYDSENPGDEAVTINSSGGAYIVAGIYGMNWNDIIVAKINPSDGGINDPNCSVYADANLAANNQTIIPSDTQANAMTQTISLSDIQITQATSNLIEIQKCPSGIYFLDVWISGNGTVTSNPPGISCGYDCLEFYPQGTAVTLTAQAEPGSIFTGWGGDCGDCSQNNWCEVDITSDMICTASFEPSSQTYSLTVSKSGTGSGTIMSGDGGINCGNDCNETYPVNTDIILTAQAEPGSLFIGWSDDCSSCGNNTQCNIIMDGDKTCTATFAPILHITASATGNGSGSINSNPSGISFNYPANNSGSAYFAYNSNVVITAQADTGSAASWNGTCVEAGGTESGNGTVTATCTFTALDTDKTVTATFTLNQYNLTVTKAGTGSGSVNATGCTLEWNGNTGTCTVAHGTQIILSPQADTGSAFTGWINGTGSAANCTGTGDCTFIITEPSTVNANFELMRNITASVNPQEGGHIACSPNPVPNGQSSVCTITINAGYHIDSVNGSCGGTLNGNIYTTSLITSDCTVEVNFAVNQYQLTVNSGGNGSGSVTSDPAGISYSYPANTTGNANFNHGTNVTLTAQADTGSTASWNGTCVEAGGTESGNGTVTATCTFTALDADKTVTATFTLNQYNLTVTKAGTGSGSVNATGCTLIWNGNTGTCTADHGTQIILTGVEDWGSVFEGWLEGSGSAANCSGTSNCTFTITEDSGVTASFRKITAIKLLSPNGGEIIPSGSTYPVKWEAPADTHHFTLKLSMDNGMTWSTIATNVTGNSYNWTVPKPANNKRKCLMRVIAFNASNVKIGADRSDGTFTIEVVKLTFPNGGETFTSGSQHDITWTTNGTKNPVSKVILSYTLNGGLTWKAIDMTGDPSNDGSFTWTVPTVSTTKTKCKVKVVLKDSAGNVIGSDLSDGFFTISPPL